MLRHMRTSVEISDALLRKARRAMAQRRVTLRHLIEEGLRKVLEDEGSTTPFRLRDAHFDGEAGFAPGVGPDELAAAIREVNEPRAPR